MSPHADCVVGNSARSPGATWLSIHASWSCAPTEQAVTSLYAANASTGSGERPRRSTFDDNVSTTGAAGALAATWTGTTIAAGATGATGATGAAGAAKAAGFVPAEAAARATAGDSAPLLQP